MVLRGTACYVIICISYPTGNFAVCGGGPCLGHSLCLYKQKGLVNEEPCCIIQVNCRAGRRRRSSRGRGMRREGGKMEAAQ